ncbi:hypothetical protein ACN9OF_01965, partial [Glaesserella parasuis]|uniref:hypothetical protein n=1 Tax=Glaesserella parasuis TaxID=738 RepID=UPI003B66FE10
VGFNPPIKSICYGYMVGQDPPYKLFFLIKHRKPLFTFSGCTNTPIALAFARALPSQAGEVNSLTNHILDGLNIVGWVLTHQ